MGLVFLRLGVSNSNVRGLVFLRLVAKDSHFWEVRILKFVG